MVDKLVKLDNEGLTLIELIIAMSISSIVFILVSGMFFTGSKINRDIYNSVEIQQQGQFIMDFITTRVMPSTSIDSIKDTENVSYYKTDKLIKLGEIRLLDTSLQEEERHIFSIQKDPKLEGRSIRHGINDVAKIELGNYIKEVYVKPLPEGTSYEKAKGIEITIEMQKGEVNLDIYKCIYFRN